MTFKPTFLYIKEHTLTGKKYFGKTVRSDVEKYLGSGSYWKKHITKHGKEHVKTVWSCLFNSSDDCQEFAEFFSEFVGIVESDQWANQIPENGIDKLTRGSGVTPAKDVITGLSLGYISCDDPRWKTGEIVGPTKGKLFTKEHKQKLASSKIGKKQNRSPEHNAKIGMAQVNTAVAYDPSTHEKIGRISCDDPRWKTGEVVGSHYGMKTKKFSAERLAEHTKRLQGNNAGKANAKSPITGESLGRISIDDPRWKTGEIVGHRKKINV